MDDINKIVDTYNEKFKVEGITYPIDKVALLTLIRDYKVESIFEIGTWKGETTLLMYLSPQVKKLKAIDINKNMGVTFGELEDPEQHHPLQEPEFYGNWYRNSTNIELEFCDSKKYEPKEGEQYDMVFIDGSKEAGYVENDFQLALKLKPKIIVWHDYNPGELRVKPIIDELTNGLTKAFPNEDVTKMCLIGYLDVKKFKESKK